MIERVTKYGGPGDPYVRICDEYALDGETLHVNRTVVPKGYVAGIEVTVRFDAGSRARMWMAKHLPGVLALYDAIRIDLALRWQLWRAR